MFDLWYNFLLTKAGFKKPTILENLTLNPDFPPVFAVVSDLLMNEARSEEKLKQKSLTASEDSGHDSAQSSLNAGSFSESSG